MQTKLKYMDTPFLYEDTATIIHCDISEEGLPYIVLDETLFYPQGGGQPYDIGTISNETSIFIVQEVRLIDGIVKHFGEFEKGQFEPGDTVTLKIDKDRRVLNSKLHTLGHVIDEAVIKLGHLDWKAGKGYHFPDSPFVEYIGELAPDATEPLKEALQQETNRLLQEDFNVKTFFAAIEDLPKFCREIPDYIPQNKPCRVAIVHGDLGIPCGGTHVKNIIDIGPVKIRKVSSKKGRIKVSYTL